jgi:hypothetical protein
MGECVPQARSEPCIFAGQQAATERTIGDDAELLRSGRGRISTSAYRLTRLYMGGISSNRAKPSRAEMPSAVAICQAAQLLTAG